MQQPTAPTLSEIFQWEVRSWSRALPLWQKHIPQARPLKVLAIGERDGGLSLWLAHQGIDVHCTDLGTFPETTRQLHERYGVAGRITYEQADATALPYADGSFDIVCFKSVIGALGSKEAQAVALREMHRVLKPQGVLLFAENLRGGPLHGMLRKRFVAWSSYWRYLDATVDRDLFSPFGRVELHTTGLLANLGRSERQRDVLARLDAALLPFFPRSWRTILYGVAVKG